jgi:four helix bundle protein
MKYQNSFRQLIVWQEGKKLTLFIYKLTLLFPPEEKFAMTSQMRRSAYSFLANIAEGNARISIKDRCNFFTIARGSLIELDCFSELAYELEYINIINYKNLLEQINKCGYLINRLKESQRS